ncbi:mitogen-activated protein kinase kinase kinase 1-like isoform X2 [Amphibalanus amphitrite]|uniref:mitogen-activated protein kinase kinase kinase 1-like isoform X2 n=1 Tax=Amphibalanus amphitrite TaxID=1232801 RepID=UPI001C902C73|nr:mitogen-activated protein kinase kinase kinase 1-like isoform X2 [Amphibalanus amphitrite]
MAGEWDGGGGSLGLLGRTNGAEPPHLTAARTRTRKGRLDVKKRPLTARTLLAVLGRPGGGRGHTAEQTDQRERATGRRPARRAAAAAADSVTGATGAAPSRESSPGRSPSACTGPPSPTGSPSEALQRRLRRLDRAKLYLLEQPGPHSFLLATDTPGHKYRVTLGPQSCSCSRSPLCVHLLFVMVRVLRLPLTDYRITCHTLKTHEVEALLQTYRRRRLSRASTLPCGDTPTPNDSTSSEERRCPICQLQMTGEQSLVRCEDGCHSFLHHRCMSVWTVEAAGRQEAACCPLCRAAWPGPLTPLVRGVWSGAASAADTAAAAAALSPPGSGTPSSSPSTPSAASPPSFSSPTPTSSTANTPSTPSAAAPPGVGGHHPQPHSHASTPTSALLSSLPATHTAGAASPPASPLVPRARTALAGLSSPAGDRAHRRGSVEPESARSPLLGRRAAGRGSLRRATVRLERLESVERRQPWSQVLGRDLVHLVFSRDWQIRDNGISRLAEALSHMVESPGGRSAADLVHQVADLLAVLCADPVYKVFYGAIKCLHVLLRSVTCCSPEEAAELRNSLTPLVDALLLRSTDANRRAGQLSAWTLAELVRGPAGQLLAAELDGLQLVLDRLLQECRSGADSWQWCLGRLLVADHLVDQFRERFSALDPESAGRVVRLAEFAHRALTHPHATVTQLAHRVFVQMALAARASPAAHEHIDALLAALDPDVRLRLARRIRGESGARPARRGRPAAGSATPRQPPPEEPPAPSSSGGRRPRPTYLPLDSGAALKRKCSPLRPPAAGDRGAALRPRHAASAAPPGGHPVYLPTAMELGEEPPVPGYLTAAANSVKDIVVHPQTQNMEGGTCDTYTEELDWRRGPLLGTGSFSTCYQARDLRSGHLMAVKQVQLSTEAGSADEQTLLQEVRLLARLQHPHVLRLLGATRRPGLVSLFTEWEAGGSVAGLLEQYGPFEDDVIRRYTCHLVDGLAYLHDNHILHRDLKGANLLVDSSGVTLRIGDLGTAAELGATATLKGEFSGQLRGTVAFMAPEVLRGQHYGRSCDVWSVGCCVIEMATGRPPWDAHTCSNHFALLFMIANSPKPPEVPARLPDDLRELVSDCHRMDGEKRPATRALLDYPCFKTVPDL